MFTGDNWYKQEIMKKDRFKLEMPNKFTCPLMIACMYLIGNMPAKPNIEAIYTELAAGRQNKHFE